MEVSHLAESELGRVWLLTHLSDFVFRLQAVVSLATLVMQVFVFVGKELFQFHGSYEFSSLKVMSRKPSPSVMLRYSTRVQKHII